MQNSDVQQNPTESLGARYDGTAVNPRTFLATDYLNHFNEAIMLLEMAADMPDCMEELEEWAPRSYVDHFRHSVFKDKDLCIEAYAHVDPSTRVRLEAVIALLDAGVLSARGTLAAALDAGNTEEAGFIAGAATQNLRALIDQASGIINGADGDAADAEPPAHIDATQAAVDALFD